MAKKSLNSTGGPQTRLDRVSRDLNRTWLHGTRPRTNDGIFRPATIVTGQQLPVDVPDAGPLKFEFDLNGTLQPVTVSQADAATSKAAMLRVLHAPEKYLKLEVDSGVPTWMGGSRAFSFPDKPAPEEVVNVADENLVLIRLPASALQEVQRVGKTCDVILSHRQAGTQTDTNLPATWQPAILLRFPLHDSAAGDKSKTRLSRGRHLSHDGAGSKVLKVEGTAQGERFYLDLLGLLPTDNVPDAPAIDKVLLFAEDAAGARELLPTWSLARTNLTREARPNQLSILSIGPNWPYLATETQPEDTLRLLQMASITNSGGYYLRSGGQREAKVLIACIVLRPTRDAVADTVPLPRAANAVIYDSSAPSPNFAIFPGNYSVHVVPAVPPGSVTFGWKRTETPVESRDDEEKFGFGSISLVEYTALDGAGRVLQDADSCSAISPLFPPAGIHVRKARDARTQSENQQGAPYEEETALLHLDLPNTAQRSRALKHTSAAEDEVLRFFRGTLKCAGPTESPYAPLGDPARRNVTITPAFRDVFGNRFQSTGGVIRKTLFYTDAVLAPAEWPGFRYCVFSGRNNSAPTLSFQVAYTSLVDADDKAARVLTLQAILVQLLGATADVSVFLHGAPLVRNPIELTHELVNWIQNVIDFEQHGRAGGTIVTPLMTFQCDMLPLSKPTLFAPTLQIVRTISNLLPRDTDLPSDPILKATILSQLTEASSRLALSSSAIQPLLAESAPPDEFAAVASAFQGSLAGTFDIRVGFLRDQFNQHELWLLPNSVFPQVPSAQSDQKHWAYATARPLSNTLWTDDLVVPDFSGKASAGDSSWHGFPLKSRHFVEQDFDDLARRAFALAEREALKPDVITQPAFADRARAALRAKDQIAQALATFDGSGDPVYLVPVFADSTSTLFGDGLTRPAMDAFLRNLIEFYAIDTFIQLPLQQPGSATFVAAFEGTVSSPFATDTEYAHVPVFSDVLIHGGDKAVTLTYSVPPGTLDPNSIHEIPPIPDKPAALAVQISHIQLIRPQDEGGTATAAFNRGPWVQLATPFELAWYGTAALIPVALRLFPAKPTLIQPVVQSPPQPDVMTAANTALLIKWGWTFGFVAEGRDTDTVHTTVRYNEPDTGPAVIAAPRVDEEWQPTSLLHCLIVMKLLDDNWTTLTPTDRLFTLFDLLVSLSTFITRTTQRTLFKTNAPVDLFDVTFPSGSPTNLQCQIMKKITATVTSIGSGSSRKKQVVLTASAEEPTNGAYLIAPLKSTPGPVNNFRPSLTLTRNEAIGGHTLDSRLVYRCATVEAPHEAWARNTWGSLTFPFTRGQSLQGALGKFLNPLLNGADGNSFAIEIASALRFQRQGLSVQTDYSLVPPDMMPSSGDEIAGLVYYECQKLLGGTGGNVIAPAEVETSSVRLHVKLSVQGDTVKRTLVEIGSIDFPLTTATFNTRVPPKKRKRKVGESRPVRSRNGRRKP